METELKRMATLPSAVVLGELLVRHEGNPPSAVLEQVGFRRDEIDRYLEQRAARCAERTGAPCAAV